MTPSRAGTSTKHEHPEGNAFQAARNRDLETRLLISLQKLVKATE